MDGFISLLKPPGMTSSDAVLFIRKLLPRGTKTGHCGTLDPDASGVLVVSVGKATRLFDYLIDKQKEYVTEVAFGASTDTQDAAGAVTASLDREVTPGEVAANLPALTGRIMQTPPMYSAVKRDGKRLYSIARAGGTVEVEPREVTVERIDYIGSPAKNRFLLRIVCRKGVYIRTLANDLGGIIGCPAHMSFLLRTRVASFDINGAATAEELKSESDVAKRLVALDSPLSFLPEIRLGAESRKSVICGNPFFCRLQSNKNGFFRVYVDNSFAGISACDDTGKHSFKCMLLS